MLALFALLASLTLSTPLEPGTGVAIRSVATGPLSGTADLVSEEVLAGNRPGKAFTPKQKQIIKQQNAQENEGKTRCESCDVETVPGKKHEKGVTPPGNETQVDHKIPRSRGGPGDVDNAQVLCRDCNLKKGSKDPGQEKSP